MAKFLYTTLIIFIFILLPIRDVYSQLYKLETKNSEIIYLGKSYDYMVPHLGRCFETAYKFHQNHWNYKSDEKITLFLNDFSDVGNAGAMVIPRNFVMVNVAPFDYTFDVMPSNERFQWLMNHELTHVVMADKSADEDIFFRNLVGGNKIITDKENPLSTLLFGYLASPRWYSPRWYHEGIAVFMETWMSGGLGRVLGGYDEMVYRAKVKENAHFYRPIGLETEGTTIDFQVGVNSYLYGTRFVAYLSFMHGFDKVTQFFSRTPGSNKFYASQFKNMFNQNVVSSWNEWVKFEKDFHNKNLDIISEYPLTEKKEFIKETLGSISRPYLNKDKNEIICAVNRPGHLAQIVKINLSNGKIEEISNVESPGLYYVTNFAYNKDEGKIYATTQNNSWRGLEIIDIKTGDKETLFDYVRILELVYSPIDKALYGMQNIDGRLAIVKLTGDFTEVSRLYSIPFGKSFFDLDISPDGSLLSGTMSTADGRQRLTIFNLDSLNLGKVDTTTIYEFEDNSASNFTFSKDGQKLFGTSYYTGVSNVFEVDIKTKSAELVTNTDIGFFRPIEISKDSLLVMEFNTQGLKPVKVAKNRLEDANSIEYLGMKVLDKNPHLFDYKIKTDQTLSDEKLIVTEGEYIPFKETTFENIYPIVEGYKDFVAYGIQLNLSDKLLLSRAQLRLTYSHNSLIPEKQRFHVNFAYNYWDWELKAGLNKTSFYDLFGPTKESRAGYFGQLSYTFKLLFDKPYSSELKVYVAHFGDLEKLPQYQNVDADFSQMNIFAIDYFTSKFTKSLGGLEHESGYKFSSYFETAYINGDYVPKLTVGYEQAILTGIRNSSIWLRGNVGKVFTNKESTYSKMYFGGFGNNYVDRLDAQRYRNLESFAGREINELSAKDFVKVGFEWNLPPIMFRELGFLPAYIRYARLSLFQSNLITDMAKDELRDYHYNVGVQLDFELVLFTLMKSTLSIGYARAFNKYIKPDNEFMISLKIM